MHLLFTLRCEPRPSQVVARLFRAPAAPDAKHGHGLAIARGLMERNGGTLTCESELGYGAKFLIRLPREAAKPA